MRILQPEFEHKDGRRILTQLLTADIKQVNFYIAIKGASLGNHYHKSTTEYFYLIEGEIIYNDLSIVGPETLFVVEPNENHTLVCLTDVKLMTFLTKPYTREEPDIWKN